MLLNVKNERTKKLILGAGGSRIRQIATDIEQSLRSFYLNDVRLKLVVQIDENLKLKGNTGKEFNAQLIDQLA